jgi:hypothetical protein
MQILSRFKASTRIAFLAITLAHYGLAQMGGGMMGGGTTGGGMMGGSLGSGGMSNGMMGSGTLDGMMGGVLGGMMGGMMGGGMGSAVWGPAVSADGTAYVVRQSAGGTNGSPNQILVSSELAAIDKTGNVVWTLPIEGPVVSQPAVGTDGQVFLTVSGYNWGFGTTGGTNSKAAGQSKLVIVPATGGKTQSVTINADLVSVPKVVPGGDSYAVYVTASDMGFMGWMWNFGNTNAQRSTGGSDLYAFSPNGTLKFSVPLSRWQFSNGR